jgi:hypothetical protein
VDWDGGAEEVERDDAGDGEVGVLVAAECGGGELLPDTTFLYALPADCPLSCPFFTYDDIIDETLTISVCQSGCLFCSDSGWTGVGVPDAAMPFDQPSSPEAPGSTMLPLSILNQDTACLPGGGIGASTGWLVTVRNMKASFVSGIGTVVLYSYDACGNWTREPFFPPPAPPAPPPAPPTCTCIRGYSGPECRTPPQAPPPAPPAQPPLFDATEIQLTSCGKQNHLPPTLEQCRRAYSNASWASPLFYSFSQPVNTSPPVWQRVTLPQSGRYLISATGAAGSGGAPQISDTCLGAAVSLTRVLERGTALYVMVGQTACESPLFCGGGGGTFILLADGTPLLVAGGGGGHCAFFSWPEPYAGCSASLTTVGNPGWRNGAGGESPLRWAVLRLSDSLNLLPQAPLAAPARRGRATAAAFWAEESWTVASWRRAWARFMAGGAGGTASAG